MNLKNWHFANEVLQKVNEGMFSLIDFLILQIKEDFGIDRIGFFLKKNGQFVFSLGIGKELPSLNEPYDFSQEIDFSKISDREKIIWDPKEDVGFDFYIVIRNRKSILGVIALDDTSSKRLFNDQEKIIFQELAQSINDLLNRQDNFKELICTDQLTGSYNRKYLDYLQEIGENIYRHQNVFAMLDIDHFKGVNDFYGHDVGDQVLRGLAKFLKKHLRPRDILIRMGGEEFFIIFNNISVENAQQRLEIIKDDFKKEEFFDSQKERIKEFYDRDGNFVSDQISFSAGICSANLEAIIKADQLLLEAKKSGRDLIRAG